MKLFAYSLLASLRPHWMFMRSMVSKPEGIKVASNRSCVIASDWSYTKKICVRWIGMNGTCDERGNQSMIIIPSQPWILQHKVNFG